MDAGSILDGWQRSSEPCDSEPVTAYIAHELRTPLATQRALLEHALGDRDVNVADWRAVAREVLAACIQQERLLEACLALSQSQAGLGQRETVDVASLVAELLRTADLQGRTVRVRLEPALTTGVPGLIERLLDNLLANAVRHNRLGGWIGISVRRSRTHAVVAVENPGRRISGEELARLFVPFQRLDSRRPRSVAGLGLGLAVVKAVADAHAARITAHARPAGGLRVEVAFPPVGRQREAPG